MGIIGQLPQLLPGQLETWLLCAAAVLGVVLVLKSLFFGRRAESEFVSKDEFRAFRTSVEADLNGLRDRIDSRHLAVLQSVEQLKATVLTDGERRSSAVLGRLAQVEASVARLDERTRHE
jgi:hypothetical protein